MRTYSQEEWDARDLEIQQEQSRLSKLSALATWFRGEDPKDKAGRGQKAWKAMQMVANGELDPDDLSAADKSAMAAMQKRIDDLQGVLEDTVGRSELESQKSEAKKDKELSWAGDDHVKRGVEYFGKYGVPLKDAIIAANRADYDKHVLSSTASSTNDDTIHGGLAPTGAPALKPNEDPIKESRAIKDRIDAAILAAVGKR